jgi:hypothetical protein
MFGFSSIGDNKVDDDDDELRRKKSLGIENEFMVGVESVEDNSKSNNSRQEQNSAYSSNLSLVSGTNHLTITPDETSSFAI